MSDPIVNFLICGTQKGGTSALDNYLRTHNQVCMGNTKEVHFFDREENFLSEAINYSKYHSYFDSNPQHKAIGEATPIYMYWKDSPKRISEYNPKMKIIILLRNPIERAFSHWNMERIRGKDSLPFWEAINTESERCALASPLQHRVYSYTDRGFYMTQLEKIWQFFPKDQVLILKNEHLKYNPLETLNEVCDFLNLTRFKSIAHKKVHARPYESELKAAEREYLKSVFESEIKALERELQWDCSDWLK